MPVTINLRVLEQEEELHLAGDLPVEEFGEDLRDELMRFDAPLHYELEAQQQPDSFLVTGTLETALACECSRCLQPFRLPLRIDGWKAVLSQFRLLSSQRPRYGQMHSLASWSFYPTEAARPTLGLLYLQERYEKCPDRAFHRPLGSKAELCLIDQAK